MKQISKKIFIGQAMLLTAFVSLTVATTAGAFKLFGRVRNGSSYGISLDETNRVYNNTTFSSESEVDGYFTSPTGASFQLKLYNVVKNNNGWQSILPGGYFYNPYTASGWNNKIKGINNISYVGDGSLELHYGWLSSNDEVIYSTEKVLSSNSVYNFETSPSYLYFKNAGSSNVNINSLNISYSCEEENFPNNNLKVLMIGNSFADDTVYYTRRVAESYGINIEIYDAYIASCTVATHYDNLQYDIASYSMRSTNGSSWVYQDDMALDDIVAYKDWDIITFQQASAQIGRPESYDKLDDLVGAVRTLAGNHPKFYWYQTWAYDKDYMDANSYFSYFGNDQEAMFDAIIDCYENQVEPLNLFEDIIPAGTAVQNARTSYMLDYLSLDGKHMSQVHGRYLLSLNFISSLLDIDLDLSPCSYRDTGIGDGYIDIAYESIRNARKQPLDITNSVYINWEMDNYDLSGYTEIDPGFVGNSYYYCMDSTDYINRIGHVSGTSNKYVSTTRFTPSTLPTGSVVFLKEGFGYRPEAWTSDSVMSTREPEAYNHVLEIDSDFWSGYQHRAFNIFKANKSDLMGQFKQIFDSFHIFVPNSKAAGLRLKSQNDYAGNDGSKFTANGLNISNYRLLHLDPIYGYYKCDSYSNLKNTYYDEYGTAKRFVCTTPFYSASNDLPVGTVIILDSGYNWRSDWWGPFGCATKRPEPTTDSFTVIDSSFWVYKTINIRVRTFNVALDDGYTQVGQNALNHIQHLRIYVPSN